MAAASYLGEVVKIRSRGWLGLGRTRKSEKYQGILEGGKKKDTIYDEGTHMTNEYE